MKNTEFNLISQNPQSTVVAEYIPAPRKAENYQSEADLEKEFIAQLVSQEYEYLPIHHEKDLILNLRKQLEKLNNFTFSDQEWKQFFEKELANPNQNIVEKTTTIQEDYRKILYHEDVSFKTINLLDKEDIHNNTLQVINQYETKD